MYIIVQIRVLNDSDQRQPMFKREIEAAGRSVVLNMYVYLLHMCIHMNIHMWSLIEEEGPILLHHKVKMRCFTTFTL
jgi:hypothetical protein